MPRTSDFSTLSWKDGFPGLIADAPWHQALETGFYRFVFDTAAITFPHFGKARPGTPLESLPAAELQLTLRVNGTTYTCRGAGEPSRFTGPRIVEAGRFFQRFDVTDLEFASAAGDPLPLEARFEVAAWPDRLGLLFSARPGEIRIAPGEDSFGKTGGGFGLDGSNHFEIDPGTLPPATAFTLAFHVFLPEDFKASSLSPWLFCRAAHEHADGNLGITLNHRVVPELRLNIGGGKDNKHTLTPTSGAPLATNRWHHFVLSYDGKQLRYFINGRDEGRLVFDTERPLVAAPLTFGRRGDNFGDGYRFRGVIDEIQWYPQALDPGALDGAASPAPAKEWTFRRDGTAADSLPREIWHEGDITLRFSRGGETLTATSPIKKDGEPTVVTLPFDPVGLTPFAEGEEEDLLVTATEHATGTVRPVAFERYPGWHRINLDAIAPISPPGVEGPSHDAIERVALRIRNPTATELPARLLFEKTAGGIHQRIGTPITGISAMLRDREGNPTGIPVQLSKNWHNDSRAGEHSGQWFHGISQLRIPPRSETELELVLSYGHWGGVPAASHAQLSLIGWGSNQRWDQSALGAWGESVCYEPDQAQGGAMITDVRPLLVTPMNQRGPWGWTNNVGGGDFFRLFDPGGTRRPPAGVKADYHRYGPCLTEVAYSGRNTEGVKHSVTTSLGRTDDLVRATYRLRLDVTEAFPFSRFVLFQIGADTYNKSHEQKHAFGNEDGLIAERTSSPGGNAYKTGITPLPGEIPWISMQDGAPPDRREEEQGAWANRGLVIRSWKAVLGGKPAGPCFAEHGTGSGTAASSTIDLVPPGDVTSLLPGDFVEATIEYLVIPQSSKDYLGPDTTLLEALEKHGNTWKMVHREASGNHRVVEVPKGTLIRRYPDIRVELRRGKADFTVAGGHGYVPLTFTGLRRHAGYDLSVDGAPLDQSVHGGDFWQTDYDPARGTWSQTFNLPLRSGEVHRIQFEPSPR